MDTTNLTMTLWNRYQDWLYYHADLEFYLDISRMRFDDRFVAEMQPKFEQAFQKMTALEGGAIANPDENRMVGHYWLRSPELSPTPEIKAEIIETLDAIEQFVAKIHSGEIKPPTQPKFTDVLSIGIGGSALGPQFVAEALSPDAAPMQIHFVDNTDPAGIDRVMARIADRLDQTLVITISKSGSTPEPRNGMLEVQQVYAKAGLKFADYAVAITIGESILDGVAKSEGWLATFPMYDWVGGRTSELSAVGLLPAALQGIDIRSMLAGAAEMDVATRIPDVKTNPAALLAMGWYFSGDGMGKKDMVVLPYKDSLLLFSRYLQQLVMESIGKQYDLDGNLVYQGIAVYGNKGSTDQHAYVQQLREGVANFFITFIEVLSDRTGPSMEVDPGVTSGDYLSGLIQGSRGALYENGRDSITITIGQVTPKMIGALIALYERAVGLYGYLVNVNAYHQPGVEAGKKAAAIVLDLQGELMKVLQAQTDTTTIGLVDLATQANAIDQIEAVYKIVRHLAANDRGVTLQGDLSKPASLSIGFKAVP